MWKTCTWTVSFEKTAQILSFKGGKKIGFMNLYQKITWNISASIKINNLVFDLYKKLNILIKKNQEKNYSLWKKVEKKKNHIFCIKKKIMRKLHI